MSYKYKKKTPEERKKEIEELTSKIPEQIEKIQNGEDFKNYLNTISSFHSYSLNNSILIATQSEARGSPATLVASYTDWKSKYHRTVKKGQHGYKILCPCQKKIKVEEPVVDPHTGKPLLDNNGEPVTDEVEKKYTYFRTGTVFDVSMTEQIPGMSEVKLDYMQPLQGEADHYDDLMHAVREISPVPIRFDSIKGDANGYYSREKKEIVIQEGMNGLMTVRTALHETAHSILHSLQRDEMKFSDGTPMERGDLEVQAEGCSYTVSKLLGLKTDDYSLPYIMGWNYEQPPDHIKKNLEIIKNTSDTIYEKLENSLLRMQAEREQQDQVLTVPQLTENLNGFMAKHRPELYSHENYNGETKDRISVAVRHNHLDFYKSELKETASDDSSSQQKEAQKLLQDVNSYSSSYEELHKEEKQSRSMKI